jgi:hypothetical protein
LPSWSNLPILIAVPPKSTPITVFTIGLSLLLWE